MLQKIQQASQRLIESATVCLFAMVKFDLTAVTVSHWLTAAKTGTMAAVLYFIVLAFTTKISDRLSAAAVMFVSVFACDLIAHDAHFGYWWTEAFVTALGSSMLAYLLYRKT